MNKYLLKYSLEFLVIVMGISLSFYLQQYVKGKDDIKKQKESLVRILQDLKSDDAIFDLTISTNENQIKAAERILKGELNNKDYNLTVPYFGTFFNDTSIKSLMNTQVISSFKNQDLITNILKYYKNDYDFIIDQSSADEDLMFKRLDYVSQNVLIDSVSYSNQKLFGEFKLPYFNISNLELNKLKLKSTYLSYLNTFIFIKISYNNFVKKAKDSNLKLQLLIKEEIKVLSK
jgi:hypothetical protein